MSPEQLKETIKKVKKFLQQKDYRKTMAFLRELHPADIAEIIENLSEDSEKIKIFELLDLELASDVIVKLSEDTRRLILEHLTHGHLADIVEDLPSDEAADILADLPEEKAHKVLSEISPEERAEVSQLLHYPEETAGGLMQTEILALPAEITAEEAIKKIRSVTEETGEKYHTIFVVNGQHQLKGVIPLYKLIIAPPKEKLFNIMEPPETVILVDEDQEEVARKFQKYDLVSAPVVDKNGKLLGRITIDDVVDVIERETSEDFYRLAGTDVEEIVYGDEIIKISRIRLPWLVTNLFGGLLTGLIMWYFKRTIGEVLALISFIPVITGMGGNVGIQSSTITVRGLATGKIKPFNFRHHLLKEIKVAFIMANVCGGIVGLIAFLWHGEPVLGLVVGLAMFCAMSVAVLMGTLMPIFLRRIGIDPAVASGPFVTTANDVVGILIYMSIATIFLKYLVT